MQSEYADLRRKQSARVLNWRPSLPTHRTVKYMGSYSRAQPMSVDLREQCSPVFDQGQMGSCSGNALAGAVEFLELKAFGTCDSASRLFIYWNERAAEGDPHVDAGVTTLLDGCIALRMKGSCAEAMWAYEQANLLSCPTHECYAAAYSHRLNYLSISDQSDMLVCLAEGYPVAMGITLFDSFELPSVARTGMVRMPSGEDQVIGGHAVLAVGYDLGERHYIVRNSWGAQWGDKGYFYLPFDYVNAYGGDLFTLR